MAVQEQVASTSGRALDAIERLSECLFGLIMVLTFTGSLSVATAERAEVRELLVGALGCNLAWGLIDAIMYLMTCLNDRGMLMRTLWTVRRASSAAQAHRAIRQQVPAMIADELTPEQLERIRARIAALPLAHARPRLHRQNLRGAVEVFLIVVGSALPVILPFLFTHDVALAMRVSNAIAIAMLALIGHAYGRASGLPAWGTAAAMVSLGLVLVALTIALGG